MLLISTLISVIVLYFIFIAFCVIISYKREKEHYDLEITVKKLKELTKKGRENTMEFNNRNLGDIITKPTKEERDKAIDEFTDLMGSLAYKLFNTYNVLRQDPQTEEQEMYGHSMFFTSFLNDPMTEEEHNKMFKLAFDYSLNIYDINKVFREKAKEGKILPLGEAIVDDTALSHILESTEFKFSITFMLPEAYKKLEEHREKERKAKEEAEKALEEMQNG